jgi:hypothetical protein
MFSWLGKIFASDASIASGLDMIDKAFHTDQEKAESLNKIIMHKDNILISWIESSKGANMSRRFLAFLVSGIWAFMFLFGWVSEQIAIWSGKLEKERLELMVASNAEYLDKATGGMLLVLGFYFAAPYMGAIVGTAIEKFTGKKTAPK